MISSFSSSSLLERPPDPCPRTKPDTVRLELICKFRFRGVFKLFKRTFEVPKSILFHIESYEGWNKIVPGIWF